MLTTWIMYLILLNIVQSLWNLWIPIPDTCCWIHQHVSYVAALHFLDPVWCMSRSFESLFGRSALLFECLPTVWQKNTMYFSWRSLGFRCIGGTMFRFQKILIILSICGHHQNLLLVYSPPHTQRSATSASFFSVIIGWACAHRSHGTTVQPQLPVVFCWCHCLKKTMYKVFFCLKASGAPKPKVYRSINFCFSQWQKFIDL